MLEKDHPLIYAIEQNQSEILKLLIDSNLYNINDVTYIGITPLIYASSKWGRNEMVKILLDAGADVNIKDNNGQSALTHAINNRNYSILDLLKQVGAKE